MATTVKVAAKSTEKWFQEWNFASQAEESHKQRLRGLRRRGKMQLESGQDGGEWKEDRRKHAIFVFRFQQVKDKQTESAPQTKKDEDRQMIDNGRKVKEMKS